MFISHGMQTFGDDRVTWLYYAARSGEGPEIGEVQRTALSVLGELAKEGNSNAGEALERLSRVPSLHPLLKEMVLDYRLSAPGNGQTA